MAPWFLSSGDDRLIYLVLVVLGATRVSIAVIAGQDLGGESTVALLLLTAGAIGLRRSCPDPLPRCRQRRRPAGPTCARGRRDR